MPGPLELYTQWLGGAQADPQAMHTPVYPIVHAAEATIELYGVNGAPWDEPTLSEALAEFGRYLSGKLKIASGRALPLEGESEGIIAWEQVGNLVESLPLRGPFSIAMVLVPRIRDRRPNAGFCIWRPDGGHCVVMQTPCACKGMRLPWPAAWRRYARRWHILHELCHTLHLPSRRDHRAVLEHCTNASCALFPEGNYRVWAKALVRGFDGPGLCRQCLEELKEAMATRSEPRAGVDVVMDWYTRRIELNPTAARAYAYRGEEHCRRGQFDEAIADLSRAIELDDQTASWYSFRGSLYIRSGQRAAALDDLRRCLTLQPDNLFAQSNLSMLLTD